LRHSLLSVSFKIRSDVGETRFTVCFSCKIRSVVGETQFTVCLSCKIRSVVGETQVTVCLSCKIRSVIENVTGFPDFGGILDVPLHRVSIVTGLWARSSGVRFPLRTILSICEFDLCLTVHPQCR
jgi:hypothetical protein